MELDFHSSPNDIRNPETQCIDLTSVYRPIREYSPEYRRSLRVGVTNRTRLNKVRYLSLSDTDKTLFLGLNYKLLMSHSNIV